MSVPPATSAIVSQSKVSPSRHVSDSQPITSVPDAQCAGTPDEAARAKAFEARGYVAVVWQ